MYQCIHAIGTFYPIFSGVPINMYLMNNCKYKKSDNDEKSFSRLITLLQPPSHIARYNRCWLCSSISAIKPSTGSWVSPPGDSPPVALCGRYWVTFCELRSFLDIGRIWCVAYRKLRLPDEESIVFNPSCS